MNILGINLSVTNPDHTADQIACWVEHHTPFYVVLCTVYTLMLGREQPDLCRIMEHAGMVPPDGMPLVYLGRTAGHTVEQVRGADLMLRLSELSAPKGYRHFFYGGQPGVAEQVAAVMQERFPGLQVAGVYSPPFRAVGELESDEVIQQINNAQPDIIWVGLGTPKQDYWMAQHRPLLHAPAMIGVGAAFDMHAGRIPQAPRWMQRMALEWLFRLLIEPKRLWRRYLIYNPLFIFNVLLHRIGIRRRPSC